MVLNVLEDMLTCTYDLLEMKIPSNGYICTLTDSSYVRRNDG